MAQISLNLSDDALESFATFHGWTAKVEHATDDQSTKTIDNPQSASDFAAQVLVNRVQNDLVEQRNRQALEEAQAQPLPTVSIDQATDDSEEA